MLTVKLLITKPVCDIKGGLIDNVYRKLCRSTGILKAVDRIVYRKSYKVKDL